ncbi:hypothetical protein [Streptomyces sp. SID2888]|uniref:hypothetical protein n=1 Tax=Streptomyces sp. SID2888 TaxID=2690256 RepID=UPI00136C42EE|nr:hypothetical protein [Streptomyces sp. SID2888]MYV47386.1 hypothetical protein [Streptomyces sp. SID2888]
MLSYWFAAVRRTAVLIAVFAVAMGAFIAGVTIWEDPGAWAEALLDGALIGVAWGAAIGVVGATSSTWGAARAASRHGLKLVAEAVTLPCTAEFRVPLSPGVTAYQLTDSVRYALTGIQVPLIDEVTEFTHGKLTLVYRQSLNSPVKLHISIVTGRDTATVTMDARPTAAWRRMDDGASWSVLTASESHVRKAVRQEAGDTTAA